MKNDSKNFISVVAYAYNNEKNIVQFLDTIVQFLDLNFSNSEIILVDDNSDDKTLKNIKEYVSNMKSIPITLMSMTRHYGLEVAMNAGIDLSIGDFVYEFDNICLDCDSRVILDVYYESLKGCDIVSASPKCKQKFSSSLFYYLFNKFSNYESNLKTETFRIVSRRAINRVKNLKKISAYRKADYSLCGLKNGNIIYDRTYNKTSKSDERYRINVALDTLLIFTNFGYYISTILVFSMLFIASFVGIYTLITYFGGKPVEGWTTTIMFLSVAFFGLFAILALIIKYLQLILNLNLNKTEYCYESIEKISK